MQDVLWRDGDADGARLSAARRQVGPGLRAEVRTALEEADPAVAGVLAVPILDPELARLLVGRFLQRRSPDLRLQALTTVAVARHLPDRVPDLLAHRASRDHGLVLAEHVPTVEVLEALLALPVPADAAPRAQYARCLAAMGEPAALPVLRALIEQQPEAHADARALAEALLRHPVGVD